MTGTRVPPRLHPVTTLATYAILLAVMVSLPDDAMMPAATACVVSVVLAGAAHYAGVWGRRADRARDWRASFAYGSAVGFFVGCAVFLFDLAT